MIDVESTVFTNIYNAIMNSELATEYDLSDDNFSTVDTLGTEPIFPFIYVHLLPGVEEMQDLNNTTINGGTFTLQIRVTDNEDTVKVKNLMDKIVEVMKGMRFNVVAMPEFNASSSSIYNQVAKFRRLIANGETL